ncbi:hypothetical protein BDR03DRAFT_1017516 [Suillus americanus]|nr:hypothetical protein BDR03DRAFT_1017516 [Suillus americanus]
MDDDGMIFDAVPTSQFILPQSQNMEATANAKARRSITEINLLIFAVQNTHIIQYLLLAIDPRTTETPTFVGQSLRLIDIHPTETIIRHSGAVPSPLIVVDHVPRFALLAAVVHAHRSRRSPSPHRGPSSGCNTSTERRSLISGHSIAGPSAQVSSTVTSIPFPLSLAVSVISSAAFDRMPPEPADTTTTRWLVENTNCLKQFNLPDSLSSSLTNPHLQNRILHLICNPPYELLNVISRGRLVVSKRTELRLRLWRAQYPDVPLWFFAIHCLSRGLDWQVFVNPHHLVGHLYGVPAPRPTYLDAKLPLLDRTDSDVLNKYEDRVKSFLRLPFARRVFTKGGLLWRLAVHYGPDDLFLSALSGPSTDASIHRNIDCNGTDIDDTLMEDHINLLIGLTSDNHSLWPPLNFFEIYQSWQGEWSPFWETWFMEHIAAINNRSKRVFIHRSDWSKKPRRHTAISYTKESTPGTEAHARRLCEQVDQLHPFMGSFATLG